MTERRRFILAHDTARRLAIEYVRTAPEGWIVDVREPKRNLDQNAKFHAQIFAISEQFVFCNRYWDAEDMKRLLIDQFRRDTVDDSEFREMWKEVGVVTMAPSLDGMGTVALGAQSRRFPKRLASAFVEWLNSFAAEHGIQWSERVTA